MRGQHKRSWDLYIDATLRWRDLTKPTIAQVHGFCIFGGWMFAAAMDLVVASDDAMFLPSLLQYFSIPWDVGVRKAKEILYQSRFVKAQEAEKLGFVNMVVPRDRLEEETTALADAHRGDRSLHAADVKDRHQHAQDEMGFRSAIKKRARASYGADGGRNAQGKGAAEQDAGSRSGAQEIGRVVIILT